MMSFKYLPKLPVLLLICTLLLICALLCGCPLGTFAYKQQIMEQRVVYGRSVRNRPLRAVGLGTGTNVTLIFGGFHGNERSGPGVVDALYSYLRQRPELWLNCKVVLVPVANPDGWQAGTRENAHRVDINRNFPGTWQGSARAARYSPGPAAASEPETRAIIRLIARYSPAKVVSIHQPFHLLNWTGARGRNLAAVMARQDHYPVTDSIGYPTPGSFGDYCGKHGIAVVTLELPPGSVATGWRQNREALMAAITDRN